MLYSFFSSLQCKDASTKRGSASDLKFEGDPQMNTDFTSVEQIIKVNGVVRSALAKLHEVLKGSKVRSRYQYYHGAEHSRVDIVYAQLLSVKWNKEHETYTVEIQLRMRDTLGHLVALKTHKMILH